MLKNNKALGQHWLYNRAILDEIARLAADGVGSVDDSGATQNGKNADFVQGNGGTGRDVKKRDEETEKSAKKIAEKTGVDTLCLEIGPGLGTLTSSLFKRFEKVIAVEFDARLAANLPKSFPGKNLEVVNGDILKFDFAKMTTPYMVAGNIPYYITSPIIKRLLTAEPAPRRIVLLIQKEVAERIADTRQTLLSLMVQNRATVELGPVVLKNLRRHQKWIAR